MYVNNPFHGFPSPNPYANYSHLNRTKTKKLITNRQANHTTCEKSDDFK